MKPNGCEMNPNLDAKIIRFRTLHGPLRTVQQILLISVPLIGGLFVLDIPGYLHMSIPLDQYLSVFIAFILGLVFLAVPPTDKADRDRVPWYDLLLAALGLTVGLYLTIRYDEILIRAGWLTVDRLVLASIAILLVLEANRRVAGWILPAVGAAFILYAAYAEFVLGGFGGRSVAWPQLVNYLYVRQKRVARPPCGSHSHGGYGFYLLWPGSILNGCWRFLHRVRFSIRRKTPWWNGQNIGGCL